MCCQLYSDDSWSLQTSNKLGSIYSIFTINHKYTSKTIYKGDSAKVLFSVGNKIYETNKDGISYRVVMDNNDLEISSFDYDYAKNTFYLTDDKNKRVIY